MRMGKRSRLARSRNRGDFELLDLVANEVKPGGILPFEESPNSSSCFIERHRIDSIYTRWKLTYDLLGGWLLRVDLAPYLVD